MFENADVSYFNAVLTERGVPMVRSVTPADLEIALYHVGKFATSPRHKDLLLLQRLEKAMRSARWLLAQTIGFNLKEDHLNALLELSFELRLRVVGPDQEALPVWEELFAMSERIRSDGVIIGGKKFSTDLEHEAFRSMLRVARELAVQGRIALLLDLLEDREMELIFETADGLLRSRHSPAARSENWRVS